MKYFIYNIGVAYNRILYDNYLQGRHIQSYCAMGISTIFTYVIYKLVVESSVQFF